MFKRICILAPVAFFGATLLVNPAVHAQTTRYVDDAGVPCPGNPNCGDPRDDGSPEDALDAIQECPDAAGDDWPTRGDPPDYFYAGGEIVSSPKPVNLVGDPRPGIVFGTSLGAVYLLTADGIPAHGWPISSGSKVGYSTAAVADLDGDETEDVVIHTNNSLEVYAQDGSLLAGWPQTLDSNISGNSIMGSPVVADIDNDGDSEILVGHFQRMYAFHHDGTAVAGWPILQQFIFGPLFSTPAVGDLDGDGEIWGGNGDPADIYLLHHDGTDVPGWPKLQLDRSGLSSPVFADVDADGALDIVVSLHFYTSGNYVRLYVWRLDGSNVPGFPVAGRWNNTPAGNAVGDIDADGFLEIFVSTINPTSPYYAVHAWNHDGTPLAGSWPRSAPLCNLNASPALADVDGGANEVIIGVGGCYMNDNGAMNVWAADGTPLPDWPQFVGGWLRSSPLVMDADGDGGPEVYVGSSDGWIYRFTTGAKGSLSAPEWNQIFHDPHNTNLYPLAAQIPGDLDGDGDVDLTDLAQLLAHYGMTEGATYEDGDLDGDGDVDLTDLAALLSHYGETYP